MPLSRSDLVRRMLRGDALAGDVAYVTAGAVPLVLVIASSLAACGARVAIAGDSSQHCSVDPAGGAAANLDRIEQALGPVTILIHGDLAAPAAFRPAEQLPSLDDTPQRSFFDHARSLAQRRIADRRGAAILAIGRSLANKAGMGLLPLFVNQAAIEAQVRNFAAEWGGYGVRANLLLAGPMADEEFPAPMSAGIARDELAPAGRLADPREVAWPALYLCSRYAAYITGATFVVDGGYRIKRSNTAPDYQPVSEWTPLANS